jgi:hypothetical protein
MNYLRKNTLKIYKRNLIYQKSAKMVYLFSIDIGLFDMKHRFETQRGGQGMEWDGEENSSGRNTSQITKEKDEK